MHDGGGVHALTDVTGFGLPATCSRCVAAPGSTRVLDGERIPFLRNARRFARDGSVTGASHRNLASYGDDLVARADRDAVERLLLADPQTSGGLLAAVAPDAVDATLDRFHRRGFAAACVVGRFAACDGAASAGAGRLDGSRRPPSFGRHARTAIRRGTRNGRCHCRAADHVG